VCACKHFLSSNCTYEEAFVLYLVIAVDEISSCAFEQVSIFSINCSARSEPDGLGVIRN